jgi:hypothetical protein
MVGEYSKQKLLASGLQKIKSINGALLHEPWARNPLDEFGLSTKILKHPKFTTTGIPYEPRAIIRPKNNDNLSAGTSFFEAYTLMIH